MAGAGNEMTPGFGHLRASHADREHVIGTLKAAFVQGRLAKEEFDQRVSQALRSRTYADLAAVTADLPARLIHAEQRREPAPARAAQPVNKPLMWGMCAVTLAGVLAGVAAFPVNSLTLLAMGVIAILVGAPVAGTLILDSWRGHHTGELPPGPAQALWAPEAEQYRGPGDDLTLAAAREDVRAGHAPGAGHAPRNGAARPGHFQAVPFQCCKISPFRSHPAAQALWARYNADGMPADLAGSTTARRLRSSA
jgi:uncharacterized protein DUF1707